MKHMSLAFLFTSLFGCMSDPSTNPFEPDQVTTGIYQLNVATIADTCDPPRSVGAATVGLFATPSAIEIVDIGANASSESHTLPAFNGYATQIPAPGERLDPCPPSNNSVAFSYLMTGASSAHVEVLAEETWTLRSACPAAETSPGGPSSLPNASCGATRELHYDLISACAAPCKVVQTAQPTAKLTCSCN